MNTVKVCVGKTRMVAHRGCSCLETENTLAAFIAAGNRSFGCLTEYYPEQELSERALNYLLLQFA